MSLELNKQEYLGSYDDICLVLSSASSKKGRLLKELETFVLSHAGNRMIPFHGTVSLLNFLGMLELKEKRVYLTEQGNHFIKERFKQPAGKSLIAQVLIKKIKDSPEHWDFLNITKIKYDSYLEKFTIRNDEIPLRCSNIRNFMINLGYLSSNHLSRNILVLENRLVSESNSELKKAYANLSLEQFKKKLELMQKYGEDAENFAVSFEKNRLKKHPHPDKIKRISVLDVTAGFDIISFRTDKSKDYDRHIEVKSYTGLPSFYWSDNEIKVAKEKGESYCLYLIDRNRLHEIGYAPVIIENPFINVFLNEKDWKKSCESWYFEKMD